MKKRCRWDIVVLVGLMVCAIAVPAIAESWQTYYGTEPLKQSKTWSIYVTRLQKDLSDTGCGELEIDGYFGEATLKVVKRFQAKHNLTVDGVVGDATKKELWNAVH